MVETDWFLAELFDFEIAQLTKEMRRLRFNIRQNRMLYARNHMTTQSTPGAEE